VFTITFCKRPLANAREVVVVQLQLLDLMIPKECGAVPMDAATHSDLISLMVRVLVAVFHEEGEELMTEVLYNPKIKPEHLARNDDRLGRHHAARCGRVELGRLSLPCPHGLHGAIAAPLQLGDQS
jgi:hypothetical protein